MDRRSGAPAEIEAAGYSSAQEFMAATMHADAERAGVRRRTPLQDSLDGVPDLVYHPVGDGADR